MTLLHQNHSKKNKEIKRCANTVGMSSHHKEAAMLCSFLSAGAQNADSVTGFIISV